MKDTDSKLADCIERKLERRAIPMEVRVQRDNDGPPVIKGYAAVFDSPALIWGDFFEVIRKGAFAKTIKEDDIRALWNHNHDCILGRTKNVTLKLSEDDHGLAVEITPPDTQYARDRVKEIEDGYVDGMSFAFNTREENWGVTKDGKPERELLDVVLFDVSPCTFPAYPDTDVAIRSFLNHCQTQTETEGDAAYQPDGEGQEPDADDHMDTAQARLAILEHESEAAELGLH